MPQPLARDPFPLRDRTVLVTGVSRRAGIGYAIARRAAAYGASVAIQHHRPHDLAQPWGGDEIAEVVAGIRSARGIEGTPVVDFGIDLVETDAPTRLLSDAIASLGHVDALVCNHAKSGDDGPLGTLDAAMLDSHYAVNTRSSILLAQEFAAQFDAAGPSGADGRRIVFLTSGQNLGAMPDEIAYAASKGALAAIAPSIARQLGPLGITVNVVNPGPVDTGYADAGTVAALATRFPSGRWGEPDDPARLISWLLTDEAAWITGQVINSEGGFRRD